MYLLDTDICIYIAKHKPVRVFERLKMARAGTVFMSVITYAELMNGVYKSNRISENLEKLRMLSELIEVVPFEIPAAETYGFLRSELEKKGTVIGGNDMLIAAHALNKKFTLVTNNEREFLRIPNLKVENWTK